MEFVNILLNSVKNLLGKKSTKDILKYLSVITMNYMGNKYNIYPYKYDPMDMKNMIYHHNINSNNQINPKESDKIINLFTIERFMNELNQQEQTSDNKMDKFIYDLAKLCNDSKIIETYNDMNSNNHILKLFDQDTLETSSIADNYEISSGGIYTPDRSILTVTNEGTMLANAKNDYLEKRMELGNERNQEEINKLLQEYYNKINQKEVEEYFTRI